MLLVTRAEVEHMNQLVCIGISKYKAYEAYQEHSHTRKQNKKIKRQAKK
ncbi:MAG: hypothetical protein ACRC17_10105 [Culicoidibacterales bacterium]